MPDKKHFILVSPKNRTVYNVRGDLLKKIIDKGYTVTVTGPNEDNLDKVLELGVRFKEIPMNKNGVNPLADIKYMISLIRLFREEKPDTVLGYTIKPVIYGSVAAKLSGIKNIYAMVTGVGYTFISKTFKARIINKLVRLMYKTGLYCAKGVIFQNKDDCKEFIDLKITNSKKCSIVNGSGVNMDKYTGEQYPEQITFFMLSRVLKSKGVKEYLEACEIVKKQYPNVRFMLLGSAEKMQDSLSAEELHRYTDAGITDYYGETDNVCEFYNQCSVFVLPSYREGTPRTILEAMAMKRAVITTDAPGCRETVKDGINGFLVPVKDSNAIAEKMIYFIENPEKITEMGNESYNYCKEKFEVGNVNNEMCKIMNI